MCVAQCCAVPEETKQQEKKERKEAKKVEKKQEETLDELVREVEKMEEEEESGEEEEEKGLSCEDFFVQSSCPGELTERIDSVGLRCSGDKAACQKRCCTKIDLDPKKLVLDDSQCEGQPCAPADTPFVLRVQSRQPAQAAAPCEGPSCVTWAERPM